MVLLVRHFRVSSRFIEDDPRNHTKQHEYFSEISCNLVDRPAGASAVRQLEAETWHYRHARLILATTAYHR